MAGINEVNPEIREEEKKQKKLVRKMKRRKRWKRFFLFCLILIIGVVVWRVISYDGLPAGIDRPDVTAITYSMADPYYSSQLASGNKKVDQALEVRELMVDSAGKAFEDLSTDLIAQDSLWEGVDQELIANINQLELSSTQLEMIRGLWAMDESNRIYFDLMHEEIELQNSKDTDPLSLSASRYERMMNVMLLTERQAEQLYMSMYRQAYMDSIADAQQKSLKWTELERAIESYRGVYSQFLYGAELMSYVDSGDYHLNAFYLEATQSKLDKMDSELSDKVKPYYNRMVEAHDKPSNYISVVSKPAVDDGLALMTTSRVYASSVDDLNKAKEIYSTSENHKKQMSDAEARACILEMILPNNGSFYGTVDLGASRPETNRKKTEEDPFGDLMMELIMNTKVNTNVKDANGRTDVTESIQELEAVNNESTEIQETLNELKPPSRDPSVEALLQKLRDEKVRQYLIQMIRDKQAESKEPLKDLGADLLDFFNDNISSNKDGGGSSNVRFNSIIEALTAQLSTHGSKYLDKEQLAAAFDFINEDLKNNLTDDQKNSVFEAFQSLNPEELLNDLGIKLMGTLGINEAINEVINAILSAFTLGFVDFDTEVTLGVDFEDFDFSEISNEYFGKPGAMNGNWKGDADVSQEIQASDVEDLPVGEVMGEPMDEVNLTVNKNGSNYSVGIPSNMGGATILENRGIKASELWVNGVDCQLNGNKLTGSSIKKMETDTTAYTVEVNVEGTVSERNGVIKGTITNTYKSVGAENITSVSTMIFNTTLQK